MRMCHFRAQNTPICPEQNFLAQTIIVTFIYLLALFIGQNSKKNLTADPRLWGCTICGPKMVHLPQTKFFWENYWHHSHLPISPFHYAKFKKNSSSRSRVMRMRNFWAQNSPFPQMRIFFRKHVNEPCFFHSCLSTCQNQSQIFIYRWNIDN